MKIFFRITQDKVDVIANEAGDFVTPAVLTLLGDGSHVSVVFKKRKLDFLKSSKHL